MIILCLIDTQSDSSKVSFKGVTKKNDLNLEMSRKRKN